MNKKHVHISKFISLVLRHKPQEIGLALDENGWADTQELIKKMSDHGTPLDMATLREVVDTNDKKRFIFNDDLSKIRASQGHSIDVDLGFTPQQPPGQLYHGTATRFVNGIRQSGLVKGSRQHVHLSEDVETMRQVGQRHGVPVILSINAAAMHSAGHQFYLSANGVWLTDHVPVSFITF